MEGLARITRVVLENYKSIAFCDVSLNPLTVLVGPNGAGKSNFLDSLRCLSEGMKAPIENALHNRGGFEQVLRRGGDNIKYLGVRVEFATATETAGYYSIRLEKVTPGEHRLVREKCFVGGEFYEFDRDTFPMPYETQFRAVLKGNQERSTPPLNTTELSLFLPLMATYSEFSQVYALLSNFRFYNFSIGELRKPADDVDSNRILRADGTNLANVFYGLGVRDNIRSAYIPDGGLETERILQYLKAVTPDLTDVKTEAFGGLRAFRFFMKSTRQPFQVNQVSDGTVRSLAVLVALFQGVPAGRMVSGVGLEEPETALHPAAAGALFDAMQEASASVQVIATTHSADLLDKKEVNTDAILSVELEGGTTTIGHVDDTGRKALRERLYTAGELMRMNYLRPQPQPLPTDAEIESLLFGDLVPA